MIRNISNCLKQIWVAFRALSIWVCSKVTTHFIFPLYLRPWIHSMYSCLKAYSLHHCCSSWWNSATPILYNKFLFKTFPSLLDWAYLYRALLFHQVLSMKVGGLAACHTKAIKEAMFWKWKCASFCMLTAEAWGRCGHLAKGWLPPHPTQPVGKSFYRWRGLHAKTAQSALRIILKLIVWRPDQCHLLALSTAGLQFQSQLALTSLRPFLGTMWNGANCVIA